LGLGFAVLQSLCAFVLVLLFAVLVPARASASLQSDLPPAPSLASITVVVQTFGRPRTDLPATIQIHSSALDSDLSTTSDKPSSVSFPNLPAGQYRITITAPSREPAQLELTLAAGQSTKVSVIVDRIFPLILNLDPNTASASASTSDLAAPEPVSAITLTDPGSPAAPAPSAPPPNAGGPNLAGASPFSDPSHSSTPDGSSLSLAPTEPATPELQPFGSPCSADEIIPRVSANVQEFVESINRITAMEFMNFERRNSKGRLEEAANNKVNYVAIIHPLDNGFLSVDEYRNGSPGMSGFSGHIASTGSVALVLIFHPVHVNEFAMSCKGLLAWHNVPAYEITFQQRLDRPNTMSEFRAANTSYAILLKGTAFVDPETFQVLHLDTDLMKPIPEVLLDAEHQSIDYGPVAFVTHNDNLWLPQVADITVHFRHKQFSERHSYTDYRLFTVDTGQKIGKPGAQYQ
jgi:hypothetical protein